MSNALPFPPRNAGLVRSALLAVLVAVAFCAMAIGPVAKSHAIQENFCTSVWLQPYGQNGDRCTAPNGGYIQFINILTYERAGCADIQNNGVLLDSWTCFGSGASGQVYYGGTRWAHGIIRNNNLSFVGRFSAGQTY